MTTLRLSQEHMDILHAHLFPGDGDEHGAVIAASVITTERGTRLLGHKLFLAHDGIDYMPGMHGYRALTADFVLDCVSECDELRMAYLAVHCHGGSTSVSFSKTDLDSHERGYPALRDIVDGPPVGGLVFAKDAVAGDIWFADGHREVLELATVAGEVIRELRPSPVKPSSADERFDRQARLFGDRGQTILRRQKVGIIGLGGVGSLIAEHLARLGVGELVLIDPDRIELSNLSRVVGSRRRDTHPTLTAARLGPLGRIFHHWRTTKVDIAHRVIREVDRGITVTKYPHNVIEPEIARSIIDCDYLFLSADSMQSRLVFNAIAQQYLIPGAQMGVKAQVNRESGNLVDLFAVYRPVIPGKGCLLCNGLIPASKLQEEATDPEQLKRQKYVDEKEVPAPSVVTMNGIAASLATNGYLMSLTGLLEQDEFKWIRHDPRTNEYIEEIPTKSISCTDCNEAGRLGRGDTMRLPTRFHG